MTQIGFLDDLGRELDGAAGRLIRGRRRVPRLLAPAVAVAAAAAVAVAVWPAPEPEREVAAEPAQTVRELLGVLRRPETGADRSPAAAEGRRDLQGPDYRLVGTTPDGKGIVLGASEKRVCVFYPDIDGGGIGCWSAEDIQSARAYASLGDHLHGVVADRVARVAVDTVDDSRIVEVHDNFWEVQIAALPDVVAVTLQDADGKTVAQRSHEAATVPVVAVPDPPGPVPPGFDATADEAIAQCMWLRYWLAAVQAGDDAVADQARRALDSAKTEPIILFSLSNSLFGDVARRARRDCGNVPPGPTPPLGARQAPR